MARCLAIVTIVGSSVSPAAAQSQADTVPSVQITPDGDAGSVLEWDAHNAQPGLNGALVVDLVVRNKRALVYNLTFRPQGVLPGVPDDSPLLPVMAHQEWTFSHVQVPAGAQVHIQASKVGNDSDGVAGLGTTTEKLFLVDLITVAEVGLSGEYPPAPDTIAQFMSSGVGLTAFNEAVDHLHNAGFDLTAASADLAAGKWDNAITKGLRAIVDSPEAFAQFAQEIGWHGMAADASNLVTLLDKYPVLNVLATVPSLSDILFAPDIVAFTLSAPAATVTAAPAAAAWPKMLQGAYRYEHTEASLLPIAGWQLPLLLPSSIDMPPFSNLRRIAAGRQGDGTNKSSLAYYVVELSTLDDPWTRALFTGQPGQQVPDFRTIGDWVCDGQPTTSQFRYCVDRSPVSDGAESFTTQDQRAITVYHLHSEGSWRWTAYWHRSDDDMTFSFALESANDWFNNPRASRDEGSAQFMIKTVSALISVSLN